MAINKKLQSFQTPPFDKNPPTGIKTKRFFMKEKTKQNNRKMKLKASNKN